MSDPLLRPFVIIETPFAGDEQKNLEYLRRALRHSFDLGEHPFASHGFYPFFLRESLPEERKAGIEFGYHFWQLATKIVFYVDLGISPGMKKAEHRALQLNRFPVEYRTLGEPQ